MAERFPIGSTMPVIWDELTQEEQQKLIDMGKLGALEEASRKAEQHAHPGFRQQPNRQMRRAIERAKRHNRG